MLVSGSWESKRACTTAHSPAFDEEGGGIGCGGPFALTRVKMVWLRLLVALKCVDPTCRCSAGTQEQGWGP